MVDLSFGYRVAKLWEYDDRWAELERDPSPVALVVMAHLKTKATRGDVKERLRWKVELVRQLYARGYARDEVLELFRFIDWVMALPKAQTVSFRDQVEALEQESKMKYVTSIERLSHEEGLEEGRKEGRKKGREEGVKQILLSQLEERFGPLDPAVRRMIQQASPEQVLSWAKRILKASSPDEVFAT